MRSLGGQEAQLSQKDRATKSCPWIHFVRPDRTQPISWLTQPNPTHYKWNNLDPTRPDTIQL